MQKNNASKILWTVLILFFALLIFIGIVASEPDYARITDVEYKAVVVDEPDSEGKIVITERLTFDIHAADEDNPFWELWRDLPEGYVDGVKVHYKVNSVKQILEDGREIIYEESPKLYWDDYDYVSENTEYGPGKWFHSEGPYDEDEAQYECVLFYVDGLYREKVVYEIEYEMYNAVLRYNDCSDLYISLYSGETIEYLESFKAEILVPNEDMPAAGNYTYTTYGTNANVFPVTESATSNPGYYTFSFDLTKEDLAFKSYNQFIEFDLISYGEDKHSFADYAPDNYYTDDDVLDEILESQADFASAPERFDTAKKVVLIVFIILSILVFILSVNGVRKIKQNNTFYTSDFNTYYVHDIPSDLDPNFAAHFILCKDDKNPDVGNIYSALLLSLARKNYITMTELKNDDVELQIIKPTEEHEALSISEKHYYNLLVRHAKEEKIKMSTFQQRVSEDYDRTTAFVTDMKESIITVGVKENYFQNALYDKPRSTVEGYAIFLLVVGIIFLTLVNLVSAMTRLDLAFGAFIIFGISCILASIYLCKKATKLILLTQVGENEYLKWRGLYNFLKDEALLQEYHSVDESLWEKYLIYATAFGLSENISKALSLKCPVSDTNTRSNSIIHNHYYRSGRFHTHGTNFHTSVQTATFGGGSGGGYGGGGRGGGGGGGGH